MTQNKFLNGLNKKLKIAVFLLVYFFSSTIPAIGFTDKEFIKIAKRASKANVINGQYEEKLKNGVQKYSVILKDSLLNGPALINYRNGLIRKKAQFKLGLLDGNYEMFNESGQPLKILNFKQGKLNGKVKYYKKGKLILEETYKDDIKNGLYKKYDSLGIELENGQYLGGKVNSKHLTQAGIKKRDQRNKAVRDGALIFLAAAAVTGVAIAAANSKNQRQYAPYGGGSAYQQYEGFYCNESLQGCCSYHHGVKAAAYQQDSSIIPVTINNRVVCNDGQFSPSCYCYPN